MYFDPAKEDLTVANLISSGLFGDGAAAVLVAGDDYEQPGPEVIDTQSTLYPDTEGVMVGRFRRKALNLYFLRRSENGPHAPGQEWILSGEERFAPERHRRVILHTGGPKVLEATQEALGVDGRRSKHRGSACAPPAIFLRLPCSVCWSSS